jgi:hypothetical protein
MLIAGLVLVTVPALASAEVPQPVIPEAKGDKCVEPTEVMRKEHFKFIKHQRDETVHEGIRTSKHSLKNCIDCHVQPDADGEYPRVTSTEHFCNSCHSYAAVKIDCFECHADRPEEAIERSSSKPVEGGIPRHGLIEELTAYLEKGEGRP